MVPSLFGRCGYFVAVPVPKRPMATDAFSLILMILTQKAHLVWKEVRHRPESSFRIVGFCRHNGYRTEGQDDARQG
jgi:hypothetical protein